MTVNQEESAQQVAKLQDLFLKLLDPTGDLTIVPGSVIQPDTTSAQSLLFNYVQKNGVMDFLKLDAQLSELLEQRLSSGNMLKELRSTKEGRDFVKAISNEVKEQLDNDVPRQNLLKGYHRRAFLMGMISMSCGFIAHLMANNPAFRAAERKLFLELGKYAEIAGFLVVMTTTIAKILENKVATEDFVKTVCADYDKVVAAVSRELKEERDSHRSFS